MLDRELVIRSLKRELERSSVALSKSPAAENSTEASTAAINAHSRVVFLFEPQQSQADFAMVERIAEALKLDSKDFHVIGRNPIEESDRTLALAKAGQGLVIAFDLRSAERIQAPQRISKAKWLSVYSPQDMQADAAKKREVWSALQQSIREWRPS